MSEGNSKLHKILELLSGHDNHLRLLSQRLESVELERKSQTPRPRVTLTNPIYRPGKKKRNIPNIGNDNDTESLSEEEEIPHLIGENPYISDENEVEVSLKPRGLGRHPHPLNLKRRGFP